MPEHKIQMFETWVVPFEYDGDELIEGEPEFVDADPMMSCAGCRDQFHSEDEAIEHIEEHQET